MSGSISSMRFTDTIFSYIPGHWFTACNCGGIGEIEDPGDPNPECRGDTTIEVKCQNGTIDIMSPEGNIKVVNPKTFQQPIPDGIMTFKLEITKEGRIFLSKSFYNDGSGSPHYQDPDSCVELHIGWCDNTIFGLKDILFWDKYDNFSDNMTFSEDFFLRSEWSL